MAYQAIGVMMDESYATMETAIETFLADLVAENPQVNWTEAELTRLRDQLPILNLRKIGITRLPESIGQLRNLQQVYLNNTPITGVPESIGQLRNLQQLYLNNTLITTIPESIGQLSKLKALDISGTQITSVPESIGQLLNLKRLYLSWLSISSIPPEIGQLLNLQELDLGGSHITSLPSEMGQLKSLRALSLSLTHITSIPPEIGQLSNLQALYLWGTRITSVAPEIGQLSNLQALFLNETRITSLPPEIGQLMNLERLDLRGTQIIKLPTSIGQLMNLRFLDIRNTPLPIPPEIAKNRSNPRQILNYYFQPARPLNEAKVVLVGDGGVGKTSLVRRIVDDAFVEGEAMTEGIAIRDWLPAATPYRLHLWDFGGQELMHSTHQFFMTKRTLYVLVLNGRTSDEQNRLEYWLKLIESFGDDSPILVVQNFADEHVRPLDQRTLQYKYPSIHGFYTTSCRTGAGIDALQAVLVTEARQLPHIHDHIPIHWFDLKERLQAERRDFVSFDLYQEWCNQAHVTYQWEQERLMRFLHDLGVIVCFHDDLRMGDTTVLNPRWITDGVYRILNTPAIRLEHRGILDYRLLPMILDSTQYPPHKRHYIVEMLQKFELGFPLPDGTERLLLPGLLPIEQPDLGSWNQSLGFLYEYDVLPSSILARWMVRMHALLDGARCWQNGAVVVDPETTNEACIIADKEARTVRIDVIGPPLTRRSLLRQIRTTFRMIHESFSALKVKELVPITDDVSVSYEHLLRLEKRGKREFMPDGLDDDYSVQQLLDGIESPAERRLQASDEYQTLREELLRLGADSYVHLTVSQLENLTLELRDKLAHQIEKAALLDETDVKYDRQREIDRTTRLLELLTMLIDLQHGIDG